MTSAPGADYCADGPKAVYCVESAVVSVGCEAGCANGEAPSLIG